MVTLAQYRRTIEFLRNRKRAFMLALGSTTKCRRKRAAYRAVFGSPAGQIVLADLMDFCRATDTCFHDDPRKHAMLEGRREVWLRVEHHLQLPPEQLYAIFGGTPVRTIQEVETDAA